MPENSLIYLIFNNNIGITILALCHSCGLIKPVKISESANVGRNKDFQHKGKEI